ncbi:hypothetical protein D187_001472 [Cystobacter fuscus DSM 2262]|uniref:Immunity protein 52 domain-containing protein n=1 Tax=Cystobacter fuscus (strain ATCC 25194 / DSM 2262 / NBRC 100088 / M29) TaxID=1242864 RepID=S9PCJ0_CYSF2|nr:DUF5953 family protein [Cystobacter fuscus]EPX60821.1 hypothetical protein D187_001472 [Cystobacter fuscus DSM 2262]
MSDAKKSLTLNIYAPSLMNRDERRLAIVHGMERAFPGLRLGWTMSKEEGLVSLPQRDEWVERERTDGDFPFLCNDDDNHVVTLGGWEIPAGRYPGAQPQLQIHAMLPLEEAAIAAAKGVLAGVAEGAQALWGHITPGNVMLVIAEQMGPKMYGPPKPPRGLPALKLPNAIPAPEIPHCLGWLNYWSDAASQTIGFPDPARDEELLSRARRTPSGGWVVPLTDAPLDLDNPAHLEALKRAYERFPEIGGRAAS